MDETEKTLDSLPLDILRDIFLRLPVESLARLTFLSDFFDDFITNDLVYSLLERATPVVQAVIHRASKVERLSNKDVLSKFRNMKFSNPFYLDEPFALAGSYNGLVCFYQCSEEQHPIHIYMYNSSTIWEGPEYSNRIYIWNPALHQITALPKSIGPNDFVAFGYDPRSQDYKILWISRGNKAEVYSWEKKSWKKIICKNLRYVPEDSRNTYIVDFEGSLHWVSVVNQFNFHVSAFNISDERLDVYRFPDCLKHVYGNMLGVFRGSLSVLAYGRSWDVSWEIWSLDKSGVDCPWTKKYHFYVQPGFLVYSSDSDYYDEEISFEQKEYISGLTASGKIMVSSRIREYDLGREYDLVDPETVSFEKLGGLARSESCFFIDYVESLISVCPPRKPRVI